MEYSHYDLRKSHQTEQTQEVEQIQESDGWETISVKKKGGSIKAGVSWIKHQDLIEMNIEKMVFREIPRIYYQTSRPGSEINISWGNC